MQQSELSLQYSQEAKWPLDLCLELWIWCRWDYVIQLELSHHQVSQLWQKCVNFALSAIRNSCCPVFSHYNYSPYNQQAMYVEYNSGIGTTTIRLSFCLFLKGWVVFAYSISRPLVTFWSDSMLITVTFVSDELDCNNHTPTKPNRVLNSQ